MSRITRLGAIAIVATLMVGWISGSTWAAPDKSQAGSVTGVVLKDGKPVANVKVGLVLAEQAKGKNKIKHAPSSDGGPTTHPSDSSAKREKPVPQATAVTDADGKFTMEAITPGDYVVMASAKGDGKGKVRVTVAAGQSATVSIDLQAPKAKNKDKDGKQNKLGL